MQRMTPLEPSDDDSPTYPLRQIVDGWISVATPPHGMASGPGWRFDATGADGLADLLVPPASGEHPFMQPLPGVTEVGVAALTLTGAEAVE
jgi:hypothetical protein